MQPPATSLPARPPAPRSRRCRTSGSANPNGSRRWVAVIPTGELIDRYGRLLAYLAPWYAGPPNDPLPPPTDPGRRTFNLDMVDAGCGALFLIYPSLPRNNDLNLLLAAAEAAWTEKRGAWAEFGENLLLGYEFRAAISSASPSSTTRPPRSPTPTSGTVSTCGISAWVGKFDYFGVPPSQRLWIWENDLAQAKLDLALSDQ